MKNDKEELYEMLHEIKTMIEQNENEDGTFRFDVIRAKVALDFARTEIEKSIFKQS